MFGSEMAFEVVLVMIPLVTIVQSALERINWVVLKSRQGLNNLFESRVLRKDGLG